MGVALVEAEAGRRDQYGGAGLTQHLQTHQQGPTGRVGHHHVLWAQTASVCLCVCIMCEYDEGKKEDRSKNFKKYSHLKSNINMVHML